MARQKLHFNSLCADAAMIVSQHSIAKIRDMVAFAKYLNQELRAVKQSLADGGCSSHGHLYITDTYGVPRVTMQVFEQVNGVHLYELNGNVSLFSGIDNPDEKGWDIIMQNLAHGHGVCTKCSHWFPKAKLKPYSYAGRACPKCFKKLTASDLSVDSSG
jgi:hypothetical protein